MESVQNLFTFIPGGDTISISILYFLGSALLAMLLSPLLINILYRLNITRTSKGDIASKLFDEKNGKLGTPIMGGLIIIISTLIITFLFNWKREYTYVPIGAMILSASIGGIDDLLNIFGGIRKQPIPIRLHIKLSFVHKSLIKKMYYFITIPWAVLKRMFLFIGSKPKSGLQVHEKILLQAFIGITVGMWVYFKNGVSTIWIPYVFNIDWVAAFFNFIPGISVIREIDSIDIGWLMIPFVALTIMTISNAVNISDGMDGLSGGLLMLAFTAYGIIAYVISEYGKLAGNESAYGVRSVVYLCATLSGSIIAYLYFNVKPARVQMGDVGSLAMGAILSIIAIMLRKEITLVFIAGVFLINGIISRIWQVFWYKLTGKKFFKMIPLHYHFALLGWPEEKVVTRFWLVSIIFTAFGIWLAGL